MSARLMHDGAVVVDVAGPAAAPPQRLGRYTLQGVLGEGAMGVVYRAHDPLLDRSVALKTFRNASAGAAQRLRNEAQAAARLSHPGIVAVYEYGEDGAQSFIAMEYVRGRPLLNALVQPAALPIDDVLCILVQLLVALQCSHEQGVWHRDIKPANLMITHEGRLKIADFGVARIDDAPMRVRGVIGSPGYLAPECYQHDAVVDQRADLYACGVLLFELLTGARPFRGSPDVVKYQTLHLPVPPLAAPGDAQFVPLARFAHVVQRALAKSPQDRYASALEMRQALTLVAERAVPHALSAPALRLLGVAPTAPTAAAHPGAAVPPAPCPPALLERLAAALADELGPVAHCIVQRAAARGHPTPAALLMRVANDALPAARRGAFIESMRGLIPDTAAAPKRSAPPPSGVVLPVLDDVLSVAPLPQPLLHRAQRVVAQQVGPLAPLLVRRAASAATTPRQFIARLAQLAAEGREREAVFARLQALLH
jgi:eukaryotic-like serine/threonine-protein kinase